MGHGRSPGFWLGETSGTNAASFRCPSVRLLGMAYVENTERGSRLRAFLLARAALRNFPRIRLRRLYAEAKGMWLEDAGWRDGPFGRLQRHAECAATEKDYGGRAEGCQETCALDIVFGQGRRLRKNAPKCFEGCPDFAEAVCGHLAVASHVCNGCGRFRSCALSKRLYVADSAQADRESLLHDSRMGVQPTDEQLSRMNASLSPSLLKGQSIRNVIANNAGVFAGEIDGLRSEDPKERRATGIGTNARTRTTESAPAQEKSVTLPHQPQ